MSEPIVYTQPSNIPRHRWTWLRLCYDDKGNFRLDLFRAFQTTITLPEFLDLEEGRICIRDRDEAMQAFLRKHPQLLT